MGTKRADQLKPGDKVKVNGRTVTVTDSYQPTPRAKGLRWVELSNGAGGAVDAAETFTT